MNRILFHGDALTWLSNSDPIPGSSIITSMPDISEFKNMDLKTWKAWFISAAQLVLSRCPHDGITAFYQTDIKRDHTWIDKGYLCQKAAEECEIPLVAHKVVCRVSPGRASFGRVGYSHLLFFSKNLKIDVEKSTADVLADAGTTTWTRGMGLEACRMACDFVKAHSTSHTILDPFCGHGSVLKIANEFGFNAIGIDRSLKCLHEANGAKLLPGEVRSVET